jgi:ABC-type bacteriocin/lantibiotic exporter with double-glycine peptidase domain
MDNFMGKLLDSTTFRGLVIIIIVLYFLSGISLSIWLIFGLILLFTYPLLKKNIIPQIQKNMDQYLNQALEFIKHDKK